MRSQTSRLRLLGYIRSHQAATVGELSRYLRLSAADIRHHLSVLESIGLVEVIGQIRDGPGRPAQVFGLSRRVLGDNLDQLSIGLMQAWLQGQGEAERQTSLRLLAGRLTRPLQAAAGAPLVVRLRRAVEWLNNHHYQAHWEASAAGPRIELGYCPYAALLEHCGDICELDRHILETLVHVPIHPLAIRETNTRGERACSFQVQT